MRKQIYADFSGLASFSLSPSPVGVERGSAVLHVIGAQVEASLTLGDSGQNSRIHCKPIHGDLTAVTAATVNVSWLLWKRRRGWVAE